MWYAMGGAGPLLICTLCLLMFLCKQCCCNKRNKNKGDGNNSYNGAGNQSAQSLNLHHGHQNQQKETAYV